METKEEKESGKKISRREAVKRIALTTGSIGLLGSLHSWGTPKSGGGLGGMDQAERQRVAAYVSFGYMSYNRSYFSSYNSYSSFYNSYGSYVAYSSRYSSSSYISYSSSSSSYPETSRGGGCACSSRTSPYTSYSSTSSAAPPTSGQTKKEVPKTTPAAPAAASSGSNVDPIASGSTLLNPAVPKDAKMIQSRLAELGLYKGAIDGIWGKRSQAGLKAFKEKNSLGNPDKWDKETQKLLFRK